MIKMIISCVGDIISATIATFMIEVKTLGRKNSLIIFFLLLGLSSFLVYFDSRSHFIIWSTISRMFLSMGFIFCY